MTLCRCGHPIYFDAEWLQWFHLPPWGIGGGPGRIFCDKSFQRLAAP